MTIDNMREKTTQNMAPSRWRRSSEAWPENAHTAKGDWTLIGAEGEQPARIYTWAATMASRMATGDGGSSDQAARSAARQ
jgi:hypothetical protein